LIGIESHVSERDVWWATGGTSEISETRDQPKKPDPRSTERRCKDASFSEQLPEKRRKFKKEPDSFSQQHNDLSRP
jgi:hypothetical protein